MGSVKKNLKGEINTFSMTDNSTPENSKPRVRKPRKSKKAALLAAQIDLIKPKPVEEGTKEKKEESSGNAALNQILADSIRKYHSVVERDFRDYREDIAGLQHLVAEYLDDFVIIGHTPDDQRVIIRYARTPGALDKLNELSKNALMRMLMADQMGGGMGGEG